VQNGVVASAYNRDGVIANINTLVDKAREEDVPVVWVQHNDEGLLRDSEEWAYVPELTRRDSEPLVHKNYGDSFENTELESLLAIVVSTRGHHGGADRRLHSFDVARRIHSWLRRDVGGEPTPPMT